MDGSMNRHEFKFPQILDWIRQHNRSKNTATIMMTGRTDG